MSIYSQITHNKIKSWVIIFIFVFLISGFFFLIGQYFHSPITYFVFGLFFSITSSFFTYFYSDKIVLFTVRARSADKREHFDFYTVVENLSIAAGLPMPKLYVIDDQAPNAFATGRDPHHAIICVTTGLLKKLERYELEGVIAHELSHIKNFDILLSSIVAVLVGSITLISDWILRSMWWSGYKDKEESEYKNPLLLIFFIIALIITPLVATLIQLALSRRREFLADADGVLLTRYPEGLASALEKIENDSYILRNASTATAHLFISNPFKKKSSLWLVNLFSTHPPIEERIKILRSM